MRKHGGIWLALLLALLAAAVLAPVAAMASEPQGIPIDTVYFPDATFRQYVKDNFDTNNDNVLSSDEIAVVTQIDVYDKSISNLTGIKYFTALEELDCSANQLTSLDVSGCTALTYLACYGNQLTSLDVSGCTELTNLYCDNNQLTSLDLSGCTALMMLDCYNNYLTSLDVSGCTELGDLYCYDNDLTSLDVSDCKALTYLYCDNNQLTSLDLSGCTALEWLYCSDNQLTSLDVSQNTALMALDCSNNQLTSLDVSENAELELYCSDQTARLGVNRSADGTWSANLAALVTGWTDKAASITKDPEEVWDEATNTVTWRDSGVQPTVTYDYNTGHNNQTMNVTLTLVPLGVGTEADVTGATVKNIAGVISGAEITVKLPAGSSLPTEKDIAVTLSRYATMTAPATADGGRTWTFTVTSEDGKTKKNYTLYIVYGVTVESGEDDHGTVTASPNPARMGDTVTLTVIPDPGYVFDRWEVSPATVTIASDNTFTMPGSAVEIKAHFKQAEYKVTLNTNGGTVNAGDVTGYVYGKGAKLPTDVTRDGYTFGGWYDNEALSGSRVTVITGTDTGDKTYWAKWTAIPGSAPVFTLPDGPQEVAVRPGERATLTAAATNATVC